MHFATIAVVALAMAASPSLSMDLTKRGEPQSKGDSAAEKSFAVQLPGAEPKGKDSYICSGFDVKSLVGDQDNPIFMTRFEPALMW